MADWTKVSQGQNDTWQPEEVGDEIVGVFVGVKNVETVNGEAVIYVIEKSDGKQVDVWGKTALVRSMVQVRIGSMVRIVYLGTKTNPKTKRNFKAFDVFSKPVESGNQATPRKDGDFGDIPPELSEPDF